jgi:hypothetical protein
MLHARCGLFLLVSVVSCQPAPQLGTPGSELAATNGSSIDAKLAVQMNDVSILYPLLDDKDGYVRALDPALQLKAILDGIGIPDMPTELQGVSVSQTEFAVIALRLDPCFASRNPAAETSCVNQLRLLLQMPGLDAAVHLFYSLSRQELLGIVKQLGEARGARELGPLAVHPILVSEGLHGAYAGVLRTIITTHARLDHMTRATFFSSLEGDDNWSFVGFEVGADQSLTRLAIGATPSDDNHEIKIVHVTEMLPDTTSPDNMRLLVDPSIAAQAPHDAQQAALDAVFRIENPTLHTSETIDCGSCHDADPAKVRVAKGVLGLSITGNPNAFASDLDLTQTTPVSTNRIPSFHMFSYLNQEPMIMTRTINETAAVVRYLNSL